MNDGKVTVNWLLVKIILRYLGSYDIFKVCLLALNSNGI